MNAFDLSIFGVLMELGFYPEEEPGADWFISPRGDVRVVVDEGEVSIVAWTDPTRRAIAWKASLSNAPTEIAAALIKQAVGQ